MNQLTTSRGIRLASRPTDIPIVEGDNDEFVGLPQKKLPIGQTKGEFYFSYHPLTCIAVARNLAH